MRRRRLVLLLLAGVAGLVLLLALALYGLARTGWMAGRVSASLSAAIGWPVHVESLAIGCFPDPWIEIDGLAIAGNEQDQGPPLVEVRAIRLDLPWGTLFGRRTHLNSIEVHAPNKRLAIDANGQGNWVPLQEKLLALQSEGPFTWSVDSLEVDEGTAELRDAQGALLVSVTGMAVEAQDIRPAEYAPIALRLAGQAGAHTFHLTARGDLALDVDHGLYTVKPLEAAGWIGGDDLPLAGLELKAGVEQVRFESATSTARIKGLQFEGAGVRASGQLEADLAGETPVVQFELVTEPFSPRRVGRFIDRPLPETADETAFSQARLSAKGKWSGQGLQVDALGGELDQSQFTGEASLPAEGPPRLRLALDQVDLDRYRGPADKAPAGPQATLESELNQLMDLDLDADITVGEARASGIIARGLRVTIEPDAPVQEQASP